jgi:arylsulfatase A-like enzyme
MRPLPIAALLTVTLAACGAEPPEQFEVISREVTWRSIGAATETRTPIGASWSMDGAGSEQAWREESLADGSLVLTGPDDTAVFPEVHHALALSITVNAPCTLSVAWRDRGQEFADDRRISGMSLAPGADARQFLVMLSDLRGVADAPDAEDGVESFELRIAAEGGGAPDVELHALSLMTDYDTHRGDTLAERRLRSNGVSRQGVAARVPGRLTGRLRMARGDRIRLGLALVGTNEPLDVRVVVGTETRSLRCTPNAGWTEVALDVTTDGIDSLVVEVEHAPDPTAVLLIGGLLHLRPAAQVLPDVILYVEDTLRADRLGTYGYARPTDPNLQRIAGEGAVFELAFATSNWTRPSSSSLMTSLTPSAHGNQTHEQRIPRGLETLAETLAAAGYATLSFVSNYHAGEWSGLAQGFDVHSEPAAFGLPLAPDTLTSARIHGPLASALASYEGVRVFVLVHSLDPHAPYAPPPEAVAALHEATFDIMAVGEETELSQQSRNYDAEIRHNDDWLGRLDQELSARGRQADTLLIFTSDHGEGFGEHGSTDHHRTLYQEELAVPLVLRWPAAIPAGLRIDQAVSLIDVAPTITGLIGVDAPPGWQGRDLSAQLLGDPTATHEVTPRPILIETIAPDDQPLPGRHLAVVLFPHKLIVRVTDDRAQARQLFDLVADPDERRDLIGDPARAELVTRLAAVAQQAIDAGPRIVDEETLVPMGAAMREWMEEMGYLR